MITKVADRSNPGWRCGSETSLAVQSPVRAVDALDVPGVGETWGTLRYPDLRGQDEIVLLEVCGGQKQASKADAYYSGQPWLVEANTSS